jgi:hypothetical protein
MPPLAFFECAAHAGEFVPDIIRHFAFWIGPSVIINQLPVRGNPYSVIIEYEVVFIIYKVKDVSVRSGEFVFRLLSEGVVPYYPVAHNKTQVVSYDFYVRGVFIAYRYVE